MKIPAIVTDVISKDGVFGLWSILALAGLSNANSVAKTQKIS